METVIDLRAAVNFLLENDYFTIVDNKLVITNKLHRETKLTPRERVDVLFPDEPGIITRQAIWAKFIKDTDIPYQVEGSEGRKYTVRQYSDGIVDDLVKIIKSCDYSILVGSVKRYYNSNTYKLLLSNYIRKVFGKMNTRGLKKRSKQTQSHTAKVEMPGKRRFRFSMHIVDRHNPEKSDWWIRMNGINHFVKSVEIRAKMTTKIRRTQPIGVMVGYSSGLELLPGKHAIILE